MNFRFSIKVTKKTKFLNNLYYLRIKIMFKFIKEKSHLKFKNYKVKTGFKKKLLLSVSE